MRSRGSASAGFTLTETVLVMLLVGILAVVAVPRFLATQDHEERFFYHDVRAALRYARVLAVASGCEVQVDFGASDYQLLQRTNCSSGAFSRSVPHPGTGAATYDGQAPAGVALASSVDPLIFDALGRSQDAAGAVVSATVTVGSQTLVTEGESGFVHEP